MQNLQKQGEIYAMCYRDAIVDRSFYFDVFLCMRENVLSQ